MAEYVTYTDTNGIAWTIITTERNMMATVADAAEPRYIPPATDQAVPIVSQGGETRVEVERRAFQGLRDLIEAYAASHRDATGLSVKAKASVPVWVWLIAGYLAYEEWGRGRRRARR